MFDLFRSRDKAVRILLGALLLLVAVSMLIYLVPGSGSSSGTQDDQVIAEIGGKSTLTIRDVQRQIKDVTRNKQVPNQMLQAYVPQMIEGMLYDRAVAYQAERMGFQVSDAELANTLQSISNGQFSDPAIYQRFVAEQGQTIPEFEENVRQNALHLRLQNVILEGVVVTPEEIKQEFMQRNDKINFFFNDTATTEMKSKVNPSSAELQEYFAKHHAGYVL